MRGPLAVGLPIGSPNRHCLFSSWAVAALRPDSIESSQVCSLGSVRFRLCLLVDQQLEFIRLANGTFHKLSIPP